MFPRTGSPVARLSHSIILLVINSLVIPAEIRELRVSANIHIILSVPSRRLDILLAPLPVWAVDDDDCIYVRRT
ncbi:hypothetical protein F5Y02DRAFT_374726 [Annulohypoxylon stygium]|nr:hypothetical protein F5Y02DRAFT_374726 [Annulohypoxylon stygium]